jgi:hypothetical protein
MHVSMCTVLVHGIEAGSSVRNPLQADDAALVPPASCCSHGHCLAGNPKACADSSTPVSGQCLTVSGTSQALCPPGMVEMAGNRSMCTATAGACTALGLRHVVLAGAPAACVPPCPYWLTRVGSRAVSGGACRLLLHVLLLLPQGSSTACAAGSCTVL